MLYILNLLSFRLLYILYVIQTLLISSYDCKSLFCGTNSLASPTLKIMVAINLALHAIYIV